MISGRVSNRTAEVPVTFLQPLGEHVTIDFVVDTGFTGTLALREAAIAALGLPYVLDIPAGLADDSRVELAVYDALVRWGDLEVEVTVLAAGHRPLLGTAMLDGYDLQAAFVEGGAVTITPRGNR